MPLLDKVLEANPAGVFKELNSVPKLKEMVNLNGMSKNMILKSYGIVPWNAQQQQAEHQQSNQNPAQAAMAWAKANPKDPRAAQILQRLSGK